MKSYPAVNKQIHRKQNLQMLEYNDIIAIHQLGKKKKKAGIAAIMNAIACTHCEVNSWNSHSAATMSIKCGDIKRRKGQVKSFSLLELRKPPFTNCGWKNVSKILLSICNADLDTRENSKQSNIRKLFIKLFLLHGIGHLSNIWIKKYPFYTWENCKYLSRLWN